MSESVRVTDCAGLGWLALWVFLIGLSLLRVDFHLRSIAESQRRIAAVYPVMESDPNTTINIFPLEIGNEN